MAEFSDIMRQWERMCKSYADCIDCPMCPVGFVQAQKPRTGCIEFAVHSPQVFACTVEQWAKEHPEPKPVTWADWLTEMGVILNASFSIWGNEFDGEARVSSKMFMPIPADIAEKLGLEPKEDV